MEKLEKLFQQNNEKRKSIFFLTHHMFSSQAKKEK
jgi:hypothetical protein